MYLNGTKSFSLLLCCLLSFSLMAKDAKITAGQGLQKPLSFIENKGQVVDENNNPRADIQYKLSTAGMNLYVASGKLYYQFRKTEGTTPETMKISTYKMGVTLLGANPDAKVVAADEQEYFENYYKSGNDNGFTVHSFNKVIYKDVYPNIDWVLYVKDGNVEYDFVVREGGDANNIKLAYDGATSLSITADGNISAETPMGIVKEKKPYAYETDSRKEVASNFKLHNNVVSFETGKYHGALTIDPYLLWSTYFGGANEDVVTSVKETTGGLTFAGGFTASNTLGFGGVGVYNKVYPGGTYDAFLTSYTATGTRTYTTYFGGASGITEGMCIALDNTGAAPNIYLAGYTNAPATGLTTAGAYHAANNGGNDGFLIKFTNAGARSWCTFYGGTGDDFIYGVTCDAANNVYITGQTASPALISSAPTVYQPALSGTTDAFVAKFSAAGAVQWSTYFGGTAQETGYAIATDAGSNVIIGGQTNSVVGIATATAFQPALNGTNDGFIAKFTTAGAISWGTYYGGEGTEQVNGVACNPANSSIAIVGNTTSLTSLASAKANQPVYGGGVQDAFVAYFTAAGAENWSTYYGGNSLDYGQGVCFDLFNNVAVAGGTFSNSGIATPGSYQSAIGGDYDAFIGKFNALGQIIWGTYFGNAFYDYANGIACDLTNDQLVIGGYTASTAGISTAGTAQTVYGGGTYDGFVTKFKKDTLVAINQPYTDTLLCATGTFNLAYTTNFNFQLTNTFTAQLSNAAGSFAAPVAIGSVATGASGVIPCTIPAGTTPGTGYRIRIVASNPSFTSPDDFYNIQILSALPHSGPSGSTPVCVGSTIYLYDTTSYVATSYNWIGPAGSGLGGTGFTSTLQNPTNTGFSGTGVNAVDAGTYSVVVTHNGCPNDTATVNIVVNKDYPPTPSDSATTPGCLGSTIYLFANSDTSAVVTYHWSGPGGFTSTLQNPSIPGATGLNAGTYYVTDTMAGCPSAKDSAIVVVDAVTPVSVTITVSPNDTVCLGTMVTFTATTTTGGVSPGFQWMTGPTSPVVGAVSSTWSTSTLTNGTAVHCVMASDIVCPSPVNASSNVITMDIINNPPLVNIVASPGTYVPYGTTITFTSYVYNVGGAIYQWSVNGVNVPGANGPTFTLPDVTQHDTVTLMVTSSLSCALPDFATSTLIVHPPTNGVANIAPELENIELFPNPNNGDFTITGNVENTNVSKVDVKIFNLIGQLIFSDEVTPQSNKISKTFDLSSTPDGIYFMNITADEGQTKILRFTVQH